MGSIQWFTNQTESHLVDRKELKGGIQNESFYRQKGAGQRSYASKNSIGCGKDTFIMVGESQADNLTGDDQLISNWLV